MSPQCYHQLVRDTGHRYPQCYGVYRHRYPRCYYVYRTTVPTVLLCIQDKSTHSHVSAITSLHRTTVTIVLTQRKKQEKLIIVSRLCMVSSCLEVRLSEVTMRESPQSNNWLIACTNIRRMREYHHQLYTAQITSLTSQTFCFVLKDLCMIWSKSGSLNKLICKKDNLSLVSQPTICSVPITGSLCPLNQLSM